MKASDLRIGNHIQTCLFDEKEEFTNIIVKHNDISACVSYPNSFRPIPITMEFIESFGFVFEYLDVDATFTEQSYRKAVRGFGSKAFEIEFNRYENTFTLDFITGELINYKYVHELQNLYYLLIGSELSV